ncbi:MAG: CrcB family protein [Arthrobacter sp.]|jgi:CrcB protein|nr:CrcB family protein [Arthrobacter sp.]
MSGLWLALGVGAAGAVGALARVALDDAWLAYRARRARHTGEPGAVGRLGALAAWPWPLLLVNVLGAFVLGYVHGALPAGSALSLAIGAGWCGGLTTFSTWAVLMAGALRERRWERALTVLLAHLVLGLGAAALGLALGGR